MDNRRVVCSDSKRLLGRRDRRIGKNSANWQSHLNHQQLRTFTDRIRDDLQVFAGRKATRWNDDFASPKDGTQFGLSQLPEPEKVDGTITSAVEGLLSLAATCTVSPSLTD